MANLGQRFVINSAGLTAIGDASDSFVGMIALQFVSDSFSGTITVKATSASPIAQADGVTPVAVLYVARFLNGSISTDGLVSTGITNNSLILVPASGQTIYLDTTGAYTSGTMTVYKMPLIGATA